MTNHDARARLKASQYVKDLIAQCEEAWVEGAKIVLFPHFSEGGFALKQFYTPAGLAEVSDMSEEEIVAQLESEEMRGYHTPKGWAIIDSRYFVP